MTRGTSAPFAAVRVGCACRRQRAVPRPGRCRAARAAHEDPLTGLANRRQLLADLVAWRQTRSAGALLLFDLNGFKAYNDRFGDLEGDALLQRAGRRLRDAVGHHGRAYRLGGDEFCVLVGEHPKSTRSATPAARRSARRSGRTTRSALPVASCCCPTRRRTSPTRCGSPTSACTPTGALRVPPQPLERRVSPTQ